MLAAVAELLLHLFVDPFLVLVGMHDRPFSGRAIAVSLLITCLLALLATVGVAIAFLVR